MYHKILADGIFVIAIIALFLAMIGWLIGDIWLASTQWLSVSSILLLIGIYVKLSADEDEKIIKEYAKKRNTKNGIN